MSTSACCGVNRNADAPAPQLTTPAPQMTRPATDGMVKLNGGRFLMGSDDKTFPSDGEGPVREITLDPFWMAETAVTNADFQIFVDATGYRTEAEQFGWSYVFHAFLPPALETKAVQVAPWWRQVFGAYWASPEGGESTIEKRLDHPVVHISWHDAAAYASWCGKRLPTEAEWEFAARGGLKQKRFPWGDQLTPQGKHRCNIWQGKFPEHNSKKDGFLGTAPVTAFRPNRYGLYNMTGNVWEWCADWFSPTFHQIDRRHNPLGMPQGTAKVTKGGSYLCHKSYCNRYRVSARTHNTPDSSTGHIGFRLVMSA